MDVTGLESELVALRVELRDVRSALEVAQRGLRTMIRGGYVEQAMGALAESEEIAGGGKGTP